MMRKHMRMLYALGVLLVFAVVAILSRWQMNSTVRITSQASMSHQKQIYLHQEKNASFDVKMETRKLNDAKVAMDDPRLIALIRNYYLEPPSLEPYNLTNKLQDFSAGQTPFLDSRMNYKENGFFVEAGAYDGEISSTTLFFEKHRKWTGLLVEPDPRNYHTLRSKKRNAYQINACLSPKPYPMEVTFNQGQGTQDQMSRIHETNESKKFIEENKIGIHTVKVQCFPFYSLLLAMGKMEVDLFSLDVEGEELHVLHTIPFDKVNFGMLTVEYPHVPEGEEGLTHFFSAKGYRKFIKIISGGCVDVVFRKRDLPRYNGME